MTRKQAKEVIYIDVEEDEDECCKERIGSPVNGKDKVYDPLLSAEDPPAPFPPEEECPTIAGPSSATGGNPVGSDFIYRKQDVFWYASMTSDPPSNFTPGVIQALELALLRTHETGRTQRAALCHSGIVHVAIESWDMGWGCGYRNFLMACTALIDQQIQPLYFPLLDDPWPPGVRNLQRSIELAWQNGYDPQGARQLKHKLVDTKKWIGTAELYVAFVSRGIPVNLVDFPKSPRGVQPLLDWILAYFGPTEQGTTAAAPISCTDRMPIILQHQGHSRTVVGYELQQNGQVNLLVFDPSRLPPSPLRKGKGFSQGNKITNYIKRRAMGPTTSKLAQDVLNASPRKRKSEENGPSREMKRTRGGEPDAPTTKAHVASGDFARMDKRGISKFVQHFSLSTPRIRQKNQYQILWFPLEVPLNYSERLDRRIVTSDRVV